MKLFGGYLLTGVGLVASLAFLHATPLSLTAQPVQTIGEVPAAPPDSIVQIVAEAQGLAPVASADLPSDGGTFWWVLPGAGIVPMPFPPQDQNAPIYDITGDGQQFLVDDTGGQVMVNTENVGLQAQATDSAAVTAEVSAESDSVLNLIEQVQDAAANQQFTMLAQAVGMDISFPGDGGGDSGTNSYIPGYSGGTPIDTNGLWLEITNDDGNFAYLNLHNGTNQVYAIWSTTNLPVGWQVETEVWPTNGTVIPTVTPFTVQNLGRQNLFLKAEDWTGVTENGNTTPDWWFWMYYGTTALSDTNLDAATNLLVTDFTNQVAPMVFSFSGLEATNNYSNFTPVPVQLDVTGAPYYEAVLMDDTNFIGAVWNPYVGSSISVPLGMTEGWHDVWIGLRGHADDTNAAVWQWKRLKLDYTPPVLIITGPTNGTVTQPVIQLTGFSPEALGSISYDLSNAIGLVTNQQVLILNQYYDTNTFEFTTNTFQAFDIPLTNGVNTLTLHATDLAGNVTTLLTNIVLDYSSATSPPAVQITWPQDGMQIAGSFFTVRGQVDDFTATVTATLVDTNGNTNVIAGVVERNGRFWLEDLPLNDGTNCVSITVSNAAGLGMVTNINLMQSTLTLTMNAIADATQLWQPTVDVDGTVSDGRYAVWVNGIPAAMNGTAWSASSVPVPPGGVASFDVTAYPAGEEPTSGSGGGVNPPTANAQNTSTNEDKPWYLYVLGDSQNLEATNDFQWLYFGSSAGGDEEQNQTHYNHLWLSGLGGFGSEYNNTQWDAWSLIEDDFWGDGMTGTMIWDWTGEGEEIGTSSSEAVNASGYTTTGFTNDAPLWIGSEHCEVKDPVDTTVNRGVILQNGTTETDIVHETYTRTAQTIWHLQTGGKALPGHRSLWQLSGGAAQIQNKRLTPPGGPFAGLSGLPTGIPDGQIDVGGLGTLGTDNNLWVTLPEAADVDITAQVAGMDFYTFRTYAQKYHLYIGLITSTTNANLDTDTPEVCVGQQVTFTLNGLPTGSIANMVGNWQLPTKYVNEQWQNTNWVLTNPEMGDGDWQPYGSVNYDINSSLLQNTNTTACWYQNKPGGPVSVGLNLKFQNGQNASVAANGNFSVVKPSIDHMTNLCSGVNMFTNADGSPLEIGLDFQSGDNGNNGIDIAVFVKRADQFTGEGFITQLVNRQLNWNANYLPGTYSDTTGGTYWLDGSNPYPRSERTFYLPTHPGQPDHPILPVRLSDGPYLGEPQTGFYDYAEGQDDFQDYIRFQPDGNGSIPVTIGRVDWGWHGKATKSGGVWSLVVSTNYINQPDTSDDSFPVWLNTYSGTKK